MVALVLGGLFVAGNVVAERIAESRIAGGLQRAFGLREAPAVDLAVFPIVTNILSGSLPGLSIAATDVQIEDVTFAEVSIEMRDLEVHGGLLGGDFSVSVGEGNVSAIVTQEEIERVLAERDERARVRIGRNRVRIRADRTFLGATRRIDATGRLVLEKKVLRFIPEEVLVDGEPPPPALAERARAEAERSATLPSLPGGFRPSRLTLRAGAVILTVRLDGKRLDLGDLAA